MCHPFSFSCTASRPVRVCETCWRFFNSCRKITCVASQLRHIVKLQAHMLITSRDVMSMCAGLFPFLFLPRSSLDKLPSERGKIIRHLLSLLVSGFWRLVYILRLRRRAHNEKRLTGGL